MGLPVLGMLALAVIAPTAGRWYVDVSWAAAQQFIRGEWFVTIALLTGIIWVICDSAGLPDLGIGTDRFAIGSPDWVLALYYAWRRTPGQRTQRDVPSTTTAAPMLSRASSKGKSQREMAMLGLGMPDDAYGSAATAVRSQADGRS